MFFWDILTILSVVRIWSCYQPRSLARFRWMARFRLPLNYSLKGGDPSPRSRRDTLLRLHPPYESHLRNLPPASRLGQPLRVQVTRVVWRAVCTRPGNVFTVAFWSTITSDSSFMESSCRLQSELRLAFRDLLDLAASLLVVPAIVVRV